MVAMAESQALEATMRAVNDFETSAQLFFVYLCETVKGGGRVGTTT